ncbi:MAG: hypothetical protein LBH13_08270 [Cellulomonadaceae bacterium]|jgi:signal transduction histidine kinase|nr:hypothetical protein [Cellulomonadaceae bacterium]
MAQLTIAPPARPTRLFDEPAEASARNYDASDVMPKRGPSFFPDLWLHQDPTRVGVLLSAANVMLYTAIALAQWAGWGGLYEATQLSGPELVGESLMIAAVNLIYGGFVIAGTFMLRPMSWPWKMRYPLIALVALVMSFPRVLAMLAMQTTPSGWLYVVTEWISGFGGGFLAVTAGVICAHMVSRARREESERLSTARRAARAVEELQTEEMRVRRMVADQLHGTLQYRLVTVTAGLDAVAADLQSRDCSIAQGTAADLRAWAETLEEIREREVRSLSHAVFPAGIELGMAHAVEAMLRRLPPHIGTTLTMDEPASAFLNDLPDAMPMAERLVVVYTVEEAITNALKHGHATRIDLRISLRSLPTQSSLPCDDASQARKEIAVTVDNNGLACPENVNLRGLARHSERIGTRGGTLRLTRRHVRGYGGTRLAFTLPFTPAS